MLGKNNLLHLFRFTTPEANDTSEIFSRHSASGEEKSRGFARDGEYASPQKELLDSIRYAKRIQLAQIPSEKRVSGMLARWRK